jgi:hypothetical protein
MLTVLEAAEYLRLSKRNFGKAALFWPWSEVCEVWSLNALSPN